MIHFSSTSYLGMNYHPDFKTLLNEGFELYGTNFGGSRLASNVPDIYDKAEEYISKKLGFEDALIVSSGTLAGHLLLTSLDQNQDFFHFKLLHPALVNKFIGKSSKEVNHPDELLTEIKKTKQENICILLNSIHPILVEKIPLDWIIKLPQDKNFTIIIDDSHGIGVLGTNGDGIISEIKNIPNHINIIVLASLGKAIGIPAGAIMGSTKFIKKIKSLAIWGGGSPTPPAYMYTYIHSEELRQHQRTKLQANIDFFKKNVPNIQDFTFIDQLPVFKYKGNGLYEKLQKKGISISRITYPTILDPITERIVLSSLHSFEDIEMLVTF